MRLYVHDTDPVAGVDHVDELLPVAGPGLQFVGDRLVPGPPGPPRDVFIGWRHLDTTETLGSQHFGALVSNGVPGPFKQMDDRLLGVLTVGLSVCLDPGSYQGES